MQHESKLFLLLQFFIFMIYIFLCVFSPTGSVKVPQRDGHAVPPEQPHFKAECCIPLCSLQTFFLFLLIRPKTLKTFLLCDAATSKPTSPKGSPRVWVCDCGFFFFIVYFLFISSYYFCCFHFLSPFSIFSYNGENMIISKYRFFPCLLVQFLLLLPRPLFLYVCIKLTTTRFFTEGWIPIKSLYLVKIL